MKPVSKLEIIQTLIDWRTTLRDSFTDLAGPAKGTISDAKVLREIDHINAAISIIRKSKIKQ